MRVLNQFAFLRRWTYWMACLLLPLLLISCNQQVELVSGVDEREANLILVFLQSKGIYSVKEQIPTQMGSQDASQGPKFILKVDKRQLFDAMTLLNQNGLPKKSGPTLLSLFAKSGLMSSDKESQIRYQAGLNQQIQNTILMIDGVIDASVQISFPSSEEGEEPNQKISAAVFVKHQGILDDPNSHLESKIKRLVAGSINGLDINDVVVVSDRSRLSDIQITSTPEYQNKYGQDLIKIWSVTMTKDSTFSFRFLFFTLLSFLLLFLSLTGWLLFKCYPILQEEGFKRFFHLTPYLKKQKVEAAPVEEDSHS